MQAEHEVLTWRTNNSLLKHTIPYCSISDVPKKKNHIVLSPTILNPVDTNELLVLQLDYCECVNKCLCLCV